jgi:hypothetical protein
LLIAYVSLDEVNQDLAARTAESVGASLASIGSPDELAASAYDAVVYDLDYLCDNDRRRILDELTAGAATRMAAVHSYNLQPTQKRALRRKGVVVRRRLPLGWLTRLVRGKKRRTGGQSLPFSLKPAEGLTRSLRPTRRMRADLQIHAHTA